MSQLQKTQFEAVAIGMKPEEVKTLVGFPERRDVFLDGEHWHYSRKGVEIIFNGDTELKVNRIIFRSPGSNKND